MKSKLKSTIILIIIILGIPVVGLTYYYFCSEFYKTVPLMSISGLSQETTSGIGVYYTIDHNVKFRPYNKTKPYVFKITPLDRKLFPKGPTDISGHVSDLNRVTHEIIFTTTYHKTHFAKDFAKGGVEAIVGMVMAPINMVRHPIKFFESIGNLGKTSYGEIKKIVSGKTDLKHIEDNVKNFADVYWNNLCCNRARMYGLDYPSLIYPSTKNIIKHDAEAYLAGKGTPYVITCFLCFSNAIADGAEATEAVAEGTEAAEAATTSSEAVEAATTSSEAVEAATTSSKADEITDDAGKLQKTEELPNSGESERVTKASSEVGNTQKIPKDEESGVQKIGGRYPINSSLAGKTHPAGVRIKETGFPDFTPYAKAEVKIEGLTGDYAKDSAMANKAVGFPNTPEGYVWHHVEDGETMQLIPKDIHSKVRHTGGASVIKHGVQ